MTKVFLLYVILVVVARWRLGGQPIVDSLPFTLMMTSRLTIRSLHLLLVLPLIARTSWMLCFFVRVTVVTWP